MELDRRDKTDLTGAKKMAAIESIVRSERWAPRRGWHDDHRHVDGTSAYLPAVQQVIGEFYMLASVLGDYDLLRGRFLQLGVGECAASHALWCALFDQGGVTIDRNGLYSNDATILAGGDTHDPATRARVETFGPFDFLFVDAGHDYHDVFADHRNYSPMVRPGGIIAFHDALFRKTYPEIEVWRYLQTLEGVTHIAASDVGVAYIVQK